MINDAGGSSSLPADARAALERGNKIEAIKCVRQAQGLSLVDAKQAVEKYLAATPAASDRYNNAQSAARAKFTGIGPITAAVLIAAAIYYLSR